MQLHTPTKQDIKDLLDETKPFAMSIDTRASILQTNFGILSYSKALDAVLDWYEDNRKGAQTK